MSVLRRLWKWLTQDRAAVTPPASKPPMPAPPAPKRGGYTTNAEMTIKAAPAGPGAGAGADTA